MTHAVEQDPHLGVQAPTLEFSWEASRDVSTLRSREWLVTNGLGGYASGTLSGGISRRYHGLLIAGLPAPHGRTMMIPYLEERLHMPAGPVDLGELQFADGTWEGQGAQRLISFRSVWRIPHWLFEADGHRLEKTLVMPHGQNTVCVSYTLLDGEPVHLELRPFLAARQHQLLGSPTGPLTLTATDHQYEVRCAEHLPTVKFRLMPPPLTFSLEHRAKPDVFYAMEHDRGYEAIDTLRSSGAFTVELAVGKPVTLIASTESWELLDIQSSALFDAERRRCESLLKLAVPAARSGMGAHLVLAAEQFLVLPGSRLEEHAIARAAGDEARTVIAGYHWFADWSRDTMISLEGLTLLTGRHHEARWILRTFSHYLKDGLLPNFFPEGMRTALYHAADATLWYFHALDRYEQATGDRETLEVLYPILKSVVDHYVQGTHFGIGVDARDGLVRADAEGYQLTWMDAKVHDWVVTPRAGKPVEIQALWYNALRLMALWAEELQDASTTFTALADQVYASFNARFWHESGGYLFDVIDGRDGDDASFRPNQLFAISLRFPVLEPSRWQPVMERVAQQLLTPVGLRTLAPGHKDYKPTYSGDLRARDAAYHQGTVWPWLIGHFVDAWRKLTPPIAVPPGVLQRFNDHLQEAGIGTISEIFDAEPPYAPRGCIAQAWSIAEVLRALVALDDHSR